MIFSVWNTLQHIILLSASIFLHRRKRPASRPALDNNQPTQQEMNVYGMIDANQSAQPETNHNDTAPNDTTTRPSGDTQVHYDVERTDAPSGDNHVYYNEQSVARAEKNEPLNNQQTSPGASLDELYSKPNKQRKPANVSQDYEYVYGHGAAGGNRGAREGVSGDGNQDLDYVDIDHSVTPDPRSVGLNPGSPGVIYAEIQRKRKDTDTVQQVDNGETPGDSDMMMVENDIYAT